MMVLAIMIAVSLGVTTESWAWVIDGTGGDCYSTDGGFGGIWEPATNTCTLKTHLTETIDISDNNITLDGDGYTITGPGSGDGVKSTDVQTYITVKNLTITGFNNGIWVRGSNHTLTNNTLTGNDFGIELDSSSFVKVTNNTASNNAYAGIHMFNAHGNILSGNTANSNSEIAGFWVDSSNDNTFNGNTANSNSGVGFYVSQGSSGNILNGNIANSNSYGIFLSGSENTLSSNTANENTYDGIHLFDAASYNKLDGNTATFNSGSGIVLWGSCDNNTVTGNTISSNTRFGIHLSSSTANIIYHNNIVDNSYAPQASDDNSASNDWHELTLLEGNHWSDYTGFDNGSGTGKHEIAGDGIGDTLIPHPAADFDFYPFVYENGWEEPANQPPVANANGPYETKTLNVLADIDPDTLNINSKGKWVTAYLVADSNGTGQVQLDGTGSNDPDGDPLTYSWTILDSGDNVVAAADGPQPMLALPVGEFDVELIVNDGNVDSDPAYSTITVELLDLTFVYPDEITLLGPAEEGSAVSGDWGEMQDAETLMIKFYREDLIPTLIPEDENVIQVDGAVTGEDTIMVINRGGRKGKKK